mmetsp:Transcript_54956/g.106075  ORF Transcript_54956/g.106075 Transcript_54956/m.106075 type:complete len:158 (+) Transcript_54956:1-474(+)
MTSTPVPAVQESLLELFQAVKDKLESLRAALPQGAGVDGVVVEEEVASEVLAQAEPLGMAVYFVSTETNGPEGEAGLPEFAPDGDKIFASVLKAGTREFVGAVALPASTPWQRGPAREVRQIWSLASLSEAGGEPLAKTLPKDATLWAAALMRKRRK